MGHTRVDAELIRQIARSLDRAAANMRPNFDRQGQEDIVQERTGRHKRIDTLAGSQTSYRNFGGFEQGQRLFQVYSRAQRRAVNDADERSENMRGYADALREALGDLEDTDELNELHFRALARLTTEAHRERNR